MPGITKRKFRYNLSKSNYEREWGKNYQKPTFRERFLAFLYKLLPKFGPLKVLQFKTPTPEAQHMFRESFNATLDKYRQLLADVRTGQLDLPNDNFDVGEATGPGKYAMNDDAHAKLLNKLADRKFAGISPELRDELLHFYSEPDAPYFTKRDAKAWATVQSELTQLKSAVPPVACSHRLKRDPDASDMGRPATDGRFFGAPRGLHSNGVFFESKKLLQSPRVRVKQSKVSRNLLVGSGMKKNKPIRKLLAANRSEIAIRIFRAANELGLRTVGIYSQEDRLALHRFKADEAYQVGAGKGPVVAYLDIASIVALAKEKGVDAIHPGYGFLSENPAFARACEKAGIVFIGPTPELLELLGDKTAARRLADSAGVPVLPGTEESISSPAEARKFAASIGYPVIVKAAMGGGGRGMRVVRSEAELDQRLEEAQGEAKSAFGDASVFLEKYLPRARHLEVQILADNHGNLLHLYERDCSVQRRHQKVVEVAPAANLPSSVRAELCDAAVRLARKANYRNAGTVEFLYDVDAQKWYFIEVNPRIQVEHTVTEMVTGIDLVRSQILVAQGHKLHDEPLALPEQANVPLYGAALQCRVTTEDP